MKKFLIPAALTLMLSAAMASCSDPVASKQEQGDAESRQFGNEMAELLGTQLGDNDRVGIEKGQLQALRIGLDDYKTDNFDNDAFLRGMREGMAMDTTDYSYLYGLQQGLMIRQELAGMSQVFDTDVDYRKFLEAYEKAFKDTLSQDDYTKFEQRMSDFQMKAMERRQKVDERRQKEALAANEKAAADYTKELIAKGYKKSPSGIVYKIDKAGTGNVSVDDMLMINYTGRHINGKEFDSSNGSPVQMSPAGVVPGFREALLLLGKGGKMTVAIPGSLAYGEQGAARAGIGPNEMLVFDLEVVDIVPQQPAQPAAPAPVQ